MSESTKYDAIYLQVCDDEDSEWCDTVTWCQDRVHESDVKYIRADLVEYLRQQLDSLTTQCEKVVRWKHMMSYSDSYFGEPAGDLKRAVYEIERAIPLAATEPKEQGK